MNSTKWPTLTNFILYLGKAGKVVADETEKGWFISWIDRDPAVIARQEVIGRCCRRTRFWAFVSCAGLLPLSRMHANTHKLELLSV